jgi:hypothetical protein
MPRSTGAGKFRLIRGLSERGWNENRIRQLFRIIDWIMDLAKPVENAFWDQLKQYREERHVPYITTPERYGREEGRQEGLSQ